ncbi:MAG: hypothetical protein GPJ01_13775 [Microcystis aeruginosa LL13-06]|nr:hypothetical protein [Microcystis aeruginosa LL13-06]
MGIFVFLRKLLLKMILIISLIYIIKLEMKTNMITQLMTFGKCWLMDQ